MSRALALLAVIAVLAVVSIWRPWRGSRWSSAPDPTGTTTSGDSPSEAASVTDSQVPRGSLAHQLERWRRAGVISAAQAAAITRLETPSASTTRVPRSAIIAEAVGYVGAILAVVGLGLIVARYWADLNTPVRLAGSGVLALAFGLGGGGVPETAPPRRRLRWFLWLASTAAAGLFAAVATRAVVVAPPRTATVVLVTALVVGLVSFVLWRGRFRPVQELTALGAGVVALGALSRVVGTPTWMSVGVWIAAVTILTLATSRLLPTHVVAEFTGAVALYVAAIMLINHSPGPGGIVSLAGAIAALVVASTPSLVASRVDALVLAVTGVVVLAQTAPVTVTYYAQGAGLVTGGLLWLIGASGLLVGVTMPMRWARLTRWTGSLSALGGAALIATQYPDRAPAVGVVTAVGLLVLGTRPDELGESIIGALGLVVNVPWLIIRLFPGQVRAPLVTLITGVLLVALALVLAREHAHRPRAHHAGGRLRH